uniref:Putative secreted protein n=1 Tax=Anopheles darlingi TaxID=43151 RepID=A0A2M4D1I3_ANODA
MRAFFFSTFLFYFFSSSSSISFSDFLSCRLVCILPACTAVVCSEGSSVLGVCLSAGGLLGCFCCVEHVAYCKGKSFAIIRTTWRNITRYDNYIYTRNCSTLVYASSKSNAQIL